MYFYYSQLVAYVESSLNNSGFNVHLKKIAPMRLRVESSKC